MAEPIVYVYSSNTEPKDMNSFKMFVKKIAQGAREDYKTTKTTTVSTVLKVGLGVPTGFAVASKMGVMPPIKWAATRFGALPVEFTAAGTLQIFRYSCFKRAALVVSGALGTLILVTIAYDGGLVVGSVANQFLSEDTKDTIGDTINQIIYEEGWKDLWRHPFGYGLGWGK